MSHSLPTPSQPTLAAVAKRARSASRFLATLSHETRSEILLAVATDIEINEAKILQANQADCRDAQVAISAGKMTSALFDRLMLDERGIHDMAMRVRDVARLPDPLGRQLSIMELDDGLVLYRESCPLGVIGMIFESRPDVISQVAALALKSGNAVLFKGGVEALRTNEAIFSVWLASLSRIPSFPVNFIHLLRTRCEVTDLLTLEHDVDLIIPRGSRAFVEYVSRNSRIPVLGHGEGICHVYVDAAANLATAQRVALDSKIQYPAACNAAETLLVHEKISRAFLPPLLARLHEAGVEVRACDQSRTLLGDSTVVPATDEDWATEYSDLILSIKIVSSVREAIDHIHRFGSNHTETIVTEDPHAAKTFLDEVDAAGVYHNVSTRFADGFRYGLGAELGVSTNKLHARGPVGLEGLTTYKYKLIGAGHIVADYASGARRFKHRQLK